MCSEFLWFQMVSGIVPPLEQDHGSVEDEAGVSWKIGEEIVEEFKYLECELIGS